MTVKRKRKKSRKYSTAETQMREHFKRYFKNYTPRDEFYAEMKREAARVGVFPSREK
jgi:hypothetical protein